jgi:hypothetical protein
MILKPRINFKRVPYSYLEAEIDTSVETDIGESLTEFANFALAAEQAAVEFGFAPEVHPMAQEAVQRGATPVPEMSPEQTVANPCNLCGNATKIDTTKNGKRVLKCDSGCMDDVNGRQYAHTVRWL